MIIQFNLNEQNICKKHENYNMCYLIVKIETKIILNYDYIYKNANKMNKLIENNNKKTFKPIKYQSIIQSAICIICFFPR